MDIMHFHIAQTNFLGGTPSFPIQGGPNKKFGTHEKLSRGCMVTLIGCRGIILMQKRGKFLDSFVENVQICRKLNEFHVFKKKRYCVDILLCSLVGLWMILD